MDYYINFSEVVMLDNTTATTVVRHIKSILACHGIPGTVITDNGSRIFQTAQMYDFCHESSSPRYPQGDGLKEYEVCIMKNLLIMQ